MAISKSRRSRSVESGFDGVHFPSDNVRISDLARAFPDEFLWSRDERHGPNLAGFSDARSRTCETLLDVLFYERELAQLALDLELHPEDPRHGSADPLIFLQGTDITRSDLVENLVLIYTELGVASGRAQAVELIRRFESETRTTTSRGRGR